MDDACQPGRGAVYHRAQTGQGVGRHHLFANFLADDHPDRGERVHWLPVDEVLMRRAASLKATGGLSYADCYAAAAAALLDCPVLTGDPEFVAAEKVGIAVSWL
ncbi:MAG: hypothetical protein DLM70_10585 [Chloroflexi bacterium]|nr:MAG: hypothetical protein DLM70_10585 [Chloroflexota bacterium]